MAIADNDRLTAEESSSDEQLYEQPEPIFIPAPETPTGFAPEYTPFDKFLVALHAYGRAEEAFRAQIRARKQIHARTSDAEVFQHDDGTLEGMWSRLRRLSDAARREFLALVATK